MNRLRTFFGTAYLLLAVLLPWAHLPLHAHEHESKISCRSGCSHEETPADDSHDHEHCGLCHLIAAPAQQPTVFTLPEPLFIFEESAAVEYHFHTPERPAHHQARAPPFKTV